MLCLHVPTASHTVPNRYYALLQIDDRRLRRPINMGSLYFPTRSIVATDANRGTLFFPDAPMHVDRWVLYAQMTRQPLVQCRSGELEFLNRAIEVGRESPWHGNVSPRSKTGWYSK
jgi:hypothetical protein